MKPLVAVLLLLASPAVAADLVVSDAFSRATAGAAPGAAYLTIQGGDAPDRLVSASSPAAGAVSLHTVTMQGEVMQMRPVPGIDIPAGATVVLRPGGFHVMLEQLKAPLRAGSTLPLVLRFERAGEKRLDVPVRALGTAPAHAH